MPENSPDTIHTDSVVVIHSLPSEERQTAVRLFSDVIEPGSKRHPGFEAKIARVENKADFLIELENLSVDCRNRNRSPVLHLEAHGAREGLIMANGEGVRWHELRNSLLEINRFTGVRLLVTLGACNGLWLAEILKPYEPSPVWAIIGPDKDVLNTTVEKAYMDFYATFLSTLDGTLALKALNGNENPTQGDFPFLTAQRLFMGAFVSYAKETRDPRGLKKRVQRLMVEGGLNAEQRGRERKRLRAFLLDFERVFRQFYDEFFLIEQHPGNAQRFPIDFSDLQGMWEDDSA